MTDKVLSEEEIKNYKADLRKLNLLTIERLFATLAEKDDDIRDLEAAKKLTEIEVEDKDALIERLRVQIKELVEALESTHSDLQLYWREDIRNEGLHRAVLALIEKAKKGGA